ncbi:sigma-54-dependent transcriptional regulator [Sandaracinus amylolyticus]|nr:sigma-54 dependent transcriptional regulator [Sandaracinus amylolyticus]
MSFSSSICVVDDDIASREAIVGLIRAAGWNAEAFESAQHYLSRRTARAPGCLILDVDMPELSGLALQQQLAEAQVDVPIIFVTGHGNIRMSVQAIKAGAVEFFTKPFDPDALLNAVEHVLAEREGRATAQRRSDVAPASTHGMVGRSARLQDMQRRIATVATTDSTVLIQGETGTGKELIARAIHEQSGRRKGPFVKVNCAAIPASLLESELMGHERGAFTGALTRRIGRFEQAHEGTIFLDEIGEMALDLQPKLLRLLQEREFERLGSPTTVRCDVRVVAATNRDLKAMTAARTFREDLYYRLSVFPLAVPSLRERKEDVPLLVSHFARQFATRMGKDMPHVDDATMERLVRYEWPGNVRELQNVIERAVILSEGPELAIEHDLGDEPGPSSGAPPRSDELAEHTRAHILKVLEAADWVIAGPSGAAARLGMKRSTLLFRMRKLGIERPSARRSH